MPNSGVLKTAGYLFTKNKAVFGQFFALLVASQSLGQLTVNPAAREESRIFYQAIFPASENIASGWNGNLSTGNEGSTTTAYKDAMYLRINYFRAMAGVSGNIVDDANFTAGAQKAALMMSSNMRLSHTPPLNWLNYSAAGADAAYKSNLTLDYGLRAISNYMEDAGTNNTPVGHRRWLLYPQTTRMGFGDVPSSGTFPAANALWIYDSLTFGQTRPTVRNSFVAWPPPGYVPYNLVYPRWSFSYPGANFASASISVQQNGVNLPVVREVDALGYGENTLVFVPGGLDPNNWGGPVRPSSDVVTSVSISNVLINSAFQNFTYNVIAFDPNVNGSDTIQPVISGADYPVIGGANTYSVNSLTLATGYQWKISRSAAYGAIDGAETGGTVTPSVAAGYNFRDNIVKAAGTFSYHLAQPTSQPASFRINSGLVPSAGAALNFKSRLGYASSTQIAKVQISLDNGALWDTVWSQAGSNAAGQASFADRSISLAAYAGKEIWVRFLYDWSSGSIYPQTSEGVGWYVDNIVFVATQTLSETTLSSIDPSTSFNLTPTGAGTYNLQVRPQVYGKYFLNWSPVRSVGASSDGNPPVVIAETRVIQLAGSMAFGSRKLKSKTIRNLTIRNTGNTSLVVSSLVYPAGFSGKWSGTIAPGASKIVKVTFTPTVKKNYKGNLTVRSNSTSGKITSPMTGKGI